ncbi:N-acetylneuraminate lyase [Shumkonia mesophila]|uniref:N-acetylneuraminate lyase n=1 Tax=Shumkonia mesophila TaxID=2838854 RepID=UPI002934CFFA|nr:N-acetylneuraminate lyase [Shumkonia mesophila]
MSRPLSGFLAALLTGFDDEGRLSENRTRAVVRHVLDYHGLDGVYVGGSSGEAFSMTIEERCRLMEIVADEVAGRALMIAQIGTLELEGGTRLGRLARQLGYDAVSAVPPFYFQHSTRELEAWFAALARAANLPMLVYYVPNLTGVRAELEGLVRLMRVPGVVGMKFTDYNLYLAERLRDACPDAAYFCGHDEIMAAAIAMGFDSGIGSTLNIQGFRFPPLVEAMRSGDLDRVHRIQKEINDVVAPIVHLGVFPALKAAIRLAGVDAGDCRPPLLMPNAEDMRLLEALRDRGAFRRPEE